MSGDDASETSLEARTQAFLAEFFNRGQELVRDLIHENEALRSRLNALQASADPTSEVVERLRKQVSELEAECERMRRLAGSVERESGGYRQRLEELEVAHYHLASRQVSAEQLRRSGSLEEVLRSTTEILLNLVGVGRFRILGIDHERGVLFELRTEGRAADGEDDHNEIPLDGESPAAAAAQRTVPWTPPAGMSLRLDETLAVPLVGGDRALGVVELVRFLPQKTDFTDHDLALLELISSESGAAMDAAWTRAHAPEVSFSRHRVEELLG
ncbi:MAG: GAF domain-containing protein [Nannocystaceae bacterium]|nr:GAF domain-containing protein [bacterium]